MTRSRGRRAPLLVGLLILSMNNLSAMDYVAQLLPMLSGLTGFFHGPIHDPKKNGTIPSCCY